MLAPPPPKVPFKDYVEATKGLKCDVWQVDLCERLEIAFWCSQADRFSIPLIDIGTGPGYYVAPSGQKIDKDEFEGNKGKGTHAAIHAFPQAGKSIIISQAYPAWILGYHPAHRFRLATYNETHSIRFSGAIRRTLLSPEHRALFPDPAGFVPLRAKAKEWSTAAREAVNDAQSSFIALGLKTGLTGSGFDTLLMDDPYKSVEEALSEVVRESTWRFYDETARTRAQEHSNVFIMFHRYHQDDMGGRALATGLFTLWRYAAQADGDYVDDETGGIWPCLPLGRKLGEYLTDRRSLAYYVEQQRNEQVWLSQFQGQPTAKTGNMFNVSLIKELPRTAYASIAAKIVHWARSWDNAATQDGGAYTAGPLMGIDAAENVFVFDMRREQVGTAQRQALQRATAEADGKLVTIHIPIDPGSAGIDIAVQFEQEFTRDGFVVVAEPVSGSKEARAYNFSKAVNSSKVFFVEGDWDIKACKNELKFFPTSTYKDQVDALADGYNHLIKLLRRGLVVKTFSKTNLVEWSRFRARFGEKIPAIWEVDVGIRLAADASRPSGWVITTRAAENAHIGEAIFVVASGRMITSHLEPLVDAVKTALNRFCVKGEAQASTSWVRSDGPDVIQLASEKYGIALANFLDKPSAGIPETNWYFEDTEDQSPFYQAPDGSPRIGASHGYVLVDDLQLDEPTNEYGALSLRQDFDTWAFNENREPQPFAGVILDCVRMCLINFAMTATALTQFERREAKLKPELRDKEVKRKLGTPEFIDAHYAREHALKGIQEEERRETKSGGEFLGPRANQRGRYRSGK